MKQEKKTTSIDWTLADIVDLEYFLAMDTGCREPVLRQRDREFYLNRICPGSRAETTSMDTAPVDISPDSREPLSPKKLIHEWVRFRRESVKSEHRNQKTDLLPGTLFQDALSLFSGAAPVTGGLFGMAVVGSFFSYTGARPLNVSFYLCLTLISQLLLLGLSGAGVYAALAGKVRFRIPRFQAAVAFLLQKCVHGFRGKKIITGMGRERRDALAGALGLVRAKHRVYGGLFFWPLFILSQLFAVGFNMGVLLITLARVFFSDVAFGWQSTLKVGPELVHQVVSLVALPWSWLFPPGTAHPTLEQITGSRMILKDGIYHLTTGDLISWWPFLCLCVFFYGLLPRFFLVFAGRRLQRRRLDRFSPDHPPCRALVLRMTTPRVSSDGIAVEDTRQTADAGVGDAEETESLIRGAHGDAAGTSHFAADGYRSEYRTTRNDLVEMPLETETPPPVDDGGMKKETLPRSGKFFEPEPKPAATVPGEKSFTAVCNALVLVSEDIDALVDEETLSRQLQNRCGMTPVRRMAVGMDMEREVKTVQTLFSIENSGEPSPLTAMVWLQEAWQPPIKETLFLLKALRRAAGPAVELVVALVGRPAPETIFTVPSSMDYRVWQQKLNALGDPYLRVIPLAEEVS